MTVCNYDLARQYELRNALLLYHDAGGADINDDWSEDEREDSLVMLHDIGEDGQINPQGKPLRASELKEVIEQLATRKDVRRAEKMDLLPPRLLCWSPGKMIWYKPSHRGIICSSLRDSKANKRIDRKEVLFPSLLFCAQGKALRAFALSSPKRPTESTKLYHAPFWNMYDKGGICMPHHERPDVRPEFIEGWERLFFDSNFSHVSRDTIKYRGGLTAFWKANAAGKFRTFPNEVLLETSMTVRSLLNESAS